GSPSPAPRRPTGCWAPAPTRPPFRPHRRRGPCTPETPCRSGLDDHRIADAHLIEVPGGVGRTEVDTAVADVRVALGSDRPRRGVDVHPTPGDANRVFDVESVTLGVIEWDADGAGIHHDHLL